MKQFKIRQLNAAEATVSFCESTAADTAGITAFAPLVADIKSKNVIVHGFNVLGGTPLQGITINVNAVRESMEQHTYKLANGTFSFAAAQSPQDSDLMAQAKLTKGSLENMSKTKCGDECDRIQQLAAVHAAGILDHGVAAADITDTAALVILYRAATDDRRAAEISRSAANTQANATLKNIMDNLLANQLDSMANTLRFTNNDWWLQYRQAREIIDPGTFSTVLKIFVVNEANNLPLKNVKCYRDESVLFKKSTTKGFITFKDIEEGGHSFVLKHKLFEDLTLENVVIGHGEKKTLNAVMFGGSGSPGFRITEFHVPPGGSILYPFSGGGNSIPPTLEIYFICINGNAVICTTDLPANACTAGFQLLEGILFHGAISGLGLDLSKTNIQITNPGLNVITVWAGVKESGL